jgi:protein TonB
MFSNNRMVFALALALSLALHIGAALFFILSGDFKMAGETSHYFNIQEIEFTPSISAPAKMASAPPVTDPALPPPTPTAVQETNIPVQDPAPVQTSESTGNYGKESERMSTPLGLGMTHGYFSGLADGSSLREDIRGYYFDMLEKINREWWDKAGMLKEPLQQDGLIDLLVQRDGTIVSIRMLKGTGSSEADRLLKEIIRSASPLPALPATYDQGMFRAPLRIKTPSFQFRKNS